MTTITLRQNAALNRLTIEFEGVEHVYDLALLSRSERAIVAGMVRDAFAGGEHDQRAVAAATLRRHQVAA